MLIRYIFSIALLFAAVPAHAISITNLDEKPHTVTVHNMGEVITRSIAPKEIMRCCYSPYVEIEMEERRQTGEGDYEYMIWPGGQLVLQKRRNHENGRGK